MVLRVREVTGEERAKLERLARATSAPVRLVERARIVLGALAGRGAPQVAAEVGVTAATARQWIGRFNDGGPAGLDDARRSGRPRTYADDAQSRVIAKARGLPPKPEGRGVPPTGHWTLDRLQEELHKDGVPIERSQIRRLLKAERVTWQKPRTWLESTDPDFAEKRGGSSGSTPCRPPAAP